MRIAFYAPMKAPDHPVPSGDRTMALAFMTALRAAGHEVALISRLRSFAATPGPLDVVSAAADVEVERLAAGLAPDLWFTYHLHYKAPDLLGPPLARRFGCPYVVAEASHALKRDRDAWAPRQALVVKALRAADAIVCLTPRDRHGLERLHLKARLIDVSPFLADSALARSAVLTPGPCRLVAVAMMRAGDKEKSHAFLAQALARVNVPFHLTLVGDGPRRQAVETFFAAFPPGQVRFAGEQDGDGVREALAEADLFVWPGFGEAFGLVYLEAQRAGVPVVALDVAGVASAVVDGVGGLTCPPDEATYAAAIQALIRDPARRATLGQAGAAFVAGERSLAPAVERLDALLRDLAAMPAT